MTALHSDSCQHFRVSPGSDPASALLYLDGAAAEAWDAVDADLAQWMEDPSQVVDEGAEAPSTGMIRYARWLLKVMRGSMSTAPAAASPDNAGGLTIEFHGPADLAVLAFRRDNCVTWSVFRDGKLVKVQPVTR